MVRSKDVFRTLALIAALELVACTRSATGNAIPTETGSPTPSQTSTSTEAPTATETPTTFPTLLPTATELLRMLSTATPEFQRSWTELRFGVGLDGNTPDLTAPFGDELFRRGNDGHVVDINVNALTLADYVRIVEKAIEQGAVPGDQEALVKILRGKLDWTKSGVTVEALSLGFTQEALDKLAQSYALPSLPPTEGIKQYKDESTGRLIPVYVHQTGAPGQPGEEDLRMVMSVHEKGSANVEDVRGAMSALVQEVKASMVGFDNLSDERIKKITDKLFNAYVQHISTRYTLDENGDTIIEETGHINRKSALSSLLSGLSRENPQLNVTCPINVITSEDATKQGIKDFTELTALDRNEANGEAPGVFYATLDVIRFEKLLDGRNAEDLTDDELFNLLWDSIKLADIDVTAYSVLPIGYGSDGVNDATSEFRGPELHIRIICGGSIDLTATPTVTVSPEGEVTVTYPAPSRTPRASQTPTPPGTPEASPTHIATNRAPETATSNPGSVVSPTPKDVTPASTEKNATPNSTPGSFPTSQRSTEVPATQIPTSGP